jgi:hypothetical protein
MSAETNDASGRTDLRRHSSSDMGQGPALDPDKDPVAELCKLYTVFSVKLELVVNDVLCPSASVADVRESLNAIYTLIDRNKLKAQSDSQWSALLEDWGALNTHYENTRHSLELYEVVADSLAATLDPAKQLSRGVAGVARDGMSIRHEALKQSELFRQKLRPWIVRFCPGQDSPAEIDTVA